jgi:hypothetical protein
MRTALILSRAMIIIVTAACLCCSTIGVEAASEHGRAVGDTHAHRNAGVIRGQDDGHHRQAQGRTGQAWDPWGHWGMYYGPMISSAI